MRLNKTIYAERRIELVELRTKEKTRESQFAKTIETPSIAAIGIAMLNPSYVPWLTLWGCNALQG